MPTRSIKFKLIVPRSDTFRSTRQALWTTHQEINHAVDYYERLLLTMRGFGYAPAGEASLADEEVLRSTDELVRAARLRNGRTGQLSEEACATVRKSLQELYGAIIPSFTGEKGNAQGANAYLGPLTDPASQGFMSIFAKIGDPPPWLEGVRSGEPRAFADAASWLKSAAGQERLAAPGSPPKWAKLAKAGSPGWIAAFVEDYDRKTEEACGVPTIVKELKALGILPLFPPCLAPRIASERGTVSRWDRLAFRLAVAHLLSWETWCRIALAEHNNRQDKLRHFEKTFLADPEIAQPLPLLVRYEQRRQAEIQADATAPGTPYRINQRMIGRWGSLREQWLAAKDQSEDALNAILDAEQAQQRGKFGDRYLFAWLAKAENHPVWARSQDLLTLYAIRNGLQSRLERAQPVAQLSLPDPQQRPRRSQWEALGGSNLKNYRVVAAGNTLAVHLPLLSAAGNGQLEEVEHLFAMAPTGQVQTPVLRSEGNSVQISFDTSAGERLLGTLGAAELVFDRKRLRHQDAARIAQGHIGPVYLQISLDILPQLPDGWTTQAPKMVNYFLSAKGNNKHQKEVAAGLRVLSVNLGVKSFAACSVFELQQGPPKKAAMALPVDVPGLWAVHERSFLLRLPGEGGNRQTEEWRRFQRGELQWLREAVNRYRRLAALGEAATAAKGWEWVESFGRMPSRTVGWDFEDALLVDIARPISPRHDDWPEFCATLRHRYRDALGKIISDWRTRTKARFPRRGMGKSLWAIEYLTDVRWFLVRWHLASHGDGRSKAFDRESRQAFASRLLDHIEAMKGDRLKTGADLIVQAARGCLRDDSGTWQQRHAPCHLVLFADPSHMSIKSDRPSRERSQLMQWSHRAIPAEVGMQGQLYGINVCDIREAFASRYHAKTMAPGIRCHSLTAEDCAEPLFVKTLAQENQGLDVQDLRPGTLVPFSEGALFVTLGGAEISVIRTDINVAQNLQRRFWTRYADAFRLTCRKMAVDSKVLWIPCAMGKRLQGSLGGLGCLTPTGLADGSCRWQALTPKQWRSLGNEAVEDKPAGEGPPDDEFAGETLETLGKTILFFRDPSGSILPPDHWYPAQRFWETVQAEITSAMAIGRC